MSGVDTCLNSWLLLGTSTTTDISTLQSCILGYRIPFAQLFDRVNSQITIKVCAMNVLKRIHNLTQYLVLKDFNKIHISIFLRILMVVSAGFQLTTKIYVPVASKFSCWILLFFGIELAAELAWGIMWLLRRTGRLTYFLFVKLISKDYISFSLGR